MFRWLLESGGGQIRDRGAHVMSCAMYWMAPDGTGPVTVEATGTPPKQGALGRRRADERHLHVQEPGLGDDLDADAHDEVASAIRAEERTRTGSRAGKISRPGYGAIYHGDTARACTGAATAAPGPKSKVRNWEPPAGVQDVYKSPGHMEDWFLGIRTGKKCIMDIEWGAGVANLCILGNLSYILGGTLQWDQAEQEIVGDEEARRMMSRPAAPSVPPVSRAWRSLPVPRNDNICNSGIRGDSNMEAKPTLTMPARADSRATTPNVRTDAWQAAGTWAAAALEPLAGLVAKANWKSPGGQAGDVEDRPHRRRPGASRRQGRPGRADRAVGR